MRCKYSLANSIKPIMVVIYLCIEINLKLNNIYGFY